MPRFARFASILLASFTIASSAYAGEVTGKIRTLTVRASDGLQFLTIDGPLAGSPPCATTPYFIIRNEASDTGKSQFAMLLSAQMSGKSVAIKGMNTCSKWADGEDIDSVTIQ